MATRSEIQQLNETLVNMLTSGQEKRAMDAVTDYTRTKIREEGFFRKIMPPIQVTKEDFDRDINDPLPRIIVDKQAESPAAVTVPLGTTPRNVYIKGPRYEVRFDRIITPRFQSDKDMLLTWHMDIRQMVSDQAMRDVQTEEDTKFISAVNSVLGGSADVNLSYNGNQPLWETISGGITRETVKESKKVMPRGPSRLSATRALVNNLTFMEFEAMGFDEMGGSISEKVFKEGFTEQEFMGLVWYTTIKHDLVPTDSVYYFADEKFIGKHFMHEDITMFMKQEAFMLSFFAYEMSGGSIGNPTGCARVDFA